jgi:asparagine synthase (glutamine-hydrolysing)
MCGIAGLVNLNGTSQVPPGVLRRMSQAIVHRGPDEDGYFEPGDITSAGSRRGMAGDAVGLASRRLSIVGLFDGRQPISNEDRQITVVFNGELFDYPEVRAQLQAKGHQFRTRCDTELLPHLWEDKGESMLEKLRGQFAIALWDQRRRQLVLARDRFGICPLFWTRQGDWLLFASEIKALIASGMVPVRPDPRGIHHIFTFFAQPGPVTCFEGIHCLVPGRYLSIRPGHGGEAAQIEERTYWQVDFPDAGDEVEPKSKAQLAQDFEAVLTKAVERRLRADVPVVSYLSGGVDSSTVVALGTHLRKSSGGSPIPTFTIQVDSPGLDEVNEARVVADYLGARPVVVKFGTQEALATYPELIRAAECPVIDTSCAALLLLAREVHHQGYKVALTGEGADEWLAGYPWFKVHKLLRSLDAVPGLPLSSWLRKAYMKRMGADFDRLQMPRTVAAAGGPNAWLDFYGLFSTAKLRLFSPEMWDQLGDHLPYDDLDLNLERAKRWSPLNRSLMLGGRIMLSGHLMCSKGDRVAMNSSVETRYPFLDEDVFAFMAQLPPRWKLHRFREKYALRLLAERWVPKSIAWRPKAMFRAPFDSFHGENGTMPEFVEQLLSEESLRKTGFFDAKAVAHWRKAFRNLGKRSGMRLAIEMGLVGVVATQLWYHSFVDASLADLPSSACPVLPLSTVGEPAA